MSKRAKLMALLLAPLILSLALIPIAHKRRQALIAQEATRALLQEAEHKPPRVAVMQHLLTQGAKVNARDASGYSALSLTALHGDLSSSRFLVAHGAQVNVRDKAGGTPLLSAVFADKTALAQLLLAHGANPNDMSQDGGFRTPLSMAVELNNAQIVSTLLARGANPNKKQPMEWFGTMTVLKYLRLRPSQYGYDTSTAFGRDSVRNAAQIKQLLLKAGAKE